jgi:hypothetical protein
MNLCMKGLALRAAAVSQCKTRRGRLAAKKKARHEAGQVVAVLKCMSVDSDAGLSDPANLEGVPAKACSHPQVFGGEWLCRVENVSPLLEPARKTL